MPGFNNAYEIISASYNQRIKKINGGIGVHILKDSQGKGAINSLYFDAIYSYHLELKNRAKINFAFQTSFFQPIP